MAYYIGLDVSQKNTSICVIDDKGKKIVEGAALTRPSDIFGWISNRVEVSDIAKVGLEATNVSSWLYTELTKLGLPMLCLEAFQAHRFLATQRKPSVARSVRRSAPCSACASTWCTRRWIWRTISAGS